MAAVCRVLFSGHCSVGMGAEGLECAAKGNGPSVINGMKAGSCWKKRSRSRYAARSAFKKARALTKKPGWAGWAIEAEKLAITLQGFALEIFLLLITRSMNMKLFM